jgi:pyruvate/2-oxoacid:ferredoxin oxidoreductase alpha subunit
MGHSYTPGLTVTERTVIRKRRLLPIPGTVLVQAGDKVGSETVVARTELPGKVHALNVANLLGAAPDEIQEYLVKITGESVRRDEVVADNKPII